MTAPLLIFPRPTRAGLLKARHPGNPNHDRAGRFASVFAPLRSKGEQRGRMLAQVPLERAQIPTLARATVDLLVRTPAVPLPRKKGLKHIQTLLESKPGLGAVQTFARKSFAHGVPLMPPLHHPPAALLDLSAVPCTCADHGLEALHKAIAEQPSEALLWRPHESPYLRALVEVFHQAGAQHLQETQDALFGALGLGTAHALLRKADAWSDEELTAVRARLNKPLATYQPDDWPLLVDLIVQTRLSPAWVAAQADLLAWKAALAGSLQAIAERGRTASAAALGGLMDRLAHAPAGPPPAVARAWNLAQSRALPFAKTRIGLHLRGLMETVRQRLSRVIVRHVEERGLARPAELAQTLRETFGECNHDWRRIAITEAGETANTAYLASFPDGAKVRRIEHYEGACPFCRQLDGQIFTWSTTPLGPEQGWTHVWPGKTNVGRSASPRKQTPEGLVARTPEELWWPAAGLQHPNCRGRWLAVPDETPPPGVDPVFADWLNAQIRAKEAEAPHGR